MGRELEAQPVQILYIGRRDSAHDSMWQQIQREGIAVAFAATQKIGLETALALQPQVVVINGCNAQFSADRVCRALARRMPNVRRLVLLDRRPDEEMPCDEYLFRPFSVRRLRTSLFQWLDDSSPNVIHMGPLRLDIAGKMVTGPGGQHHLTPKQCKLLAIFMGRPNQVISRKDLMDEIWETEYLGDTRTLDVHIRWLREKIEADSKHPELLITQRGTGYTLAISEPAAVEDEQPEGVLEAN